MSSKPKKTSAPSKFISDLEFQFLHDKHIVQVNSEFYVPDHRRRVDLARTKQKLDNNWDFADHLYDMLDRDVISLDVKVYAKPSDLNEPEGLEGKEYDQAMKELDQKVQDLDCTHLELVDHITDKEMVGHYAFGSPLYTIFIEKFSTGIQPGKKLRTS